MPVHCQEVDNHFGLGCIIFNCFTNEKNIRMLIEPIVGRQRRHPFASAKQMSVNFLQQSYRGRHTCRTIATQEVDVLFVWLQDLEGRDSGSPRLYPCMYCGTSFPHQSKLTRHILSHSLDSLKYRELQHHVGLSLPEPLNLMESHFTSRGPSVAHEPPDPTDQPPTPMDLELGSDGAGVVLCKFCGKSFPDVSSLIAHLPVHTGDRPFKCEFCGKAFKLRHHMKDHCRVHTGERPFRCALCGKTFSRSTILKAHEKTHYPKYVRKFLSPSPLDTEEESPHQQPLTISEIVPSN